ncbi:MAG: putative lipid II flippase FtsW [Deltaproteobacteria bacterium]|nr:putative lipid II flippase FtsW [Deltaproteobacteria bacterium]
MQESKKKEKAIKYDLNLLFPVLLLVGLGLVMIYSASAAIAMKKFGIDYFFVKKQIYSALAGIIILIFCSHFPYKYYNMLAYPFLIISIAMLVLIHFAGFGYSAGGALRWLRVGEFTFQPSEFVRFAMVVYLAYSMNKKRDGLKKFTVGCVPHFIVFAIFAFLIFIQPDFGSIVILGAITWIMLFIGGVRLWHLLASFAVLLPVFCYMMMGAAYRVRRLLSFLDPWQYKADEGYQIVHSLMAFGTGGVWGAGVGKGYQKLFYLPESHTDFIFSVIGEELGLVGVIFIICLYVIILWRGIIIAGKTEDSFGSFVAGGITIALGLQVCANMGVALGLLPTKGMTLPFLSYGGTSLLISMASIGVLLNIGSSVSRQE